VCDVPREHAARGHGFEREREEKREKRGKIADNGMILIEATFTRDRHG